MRFAGMDARSADATREAAPAAPRVPWSGGVMTVIMPQRLQADCPPDSERGGLRFAARQHTVECQLRVRRAFEQTTRDQVAARRCGESARECLELAATMRASQADAERRTGNGGDSRGRERHVAVQGDAPGDGGTHTQRTQPRRGTYLLVGEAFHGQAACGALSLTEGLDDARLTWAGGFDKWRVATALAKSRHGFDTVEGDALDVFEQIELLPYADLYGLGSPCQRASWAAWVASQGTDRPCDPPDGDHPMNQLLWQQIAPFKRRAKALIIEFPTGVLKVASASNPEPGWLHRKMLAEIEGRGEEPGPKWVYHVWKLNAKFHGSKAARRRLKTFAFAPEVVEAADRAGVSFPEMPAPWPVCAQRTLRDALFDDAVIDAYHPHLYLKVVLVPRELRHDGTDVAQASRVETGQKEPEPISDVRLPSLPMKCYGDFPLVMLEDGRVRRLLPAEFLRVGGHAWSVGWGLTLPDDEGEYDGSELETLKTLGGNTWDAELTKVVLRAATLYMQPWLSEQADEVAAPQRVALRFAAIMNRVGLPARWALRRWRMTVVRGQWALQRFRGAVDELITRMRALGTGGSSRARKADDNSDADDAAGDGEGAADDVDMDMGRSAGLAKMRAQGDVLEPGPAAGVSHSSSMFLTAALDTQMCGTFGFTQCVHMDEERVPVVRRTHSQRMWGAVMGATAEVRRGELALRRLPELRVPPVTRRPPEPLVPTAEEQAAFRAECPTRAACYMPTGRQKQDAYDEGMARDAEGLRKHGATGPTAWRVRMIPGQPGSEFRLYTEDYAPAVRGKKVEFDEEDRPRLHVPVPIEQRMASVGGSVIIRFDLIYAYLVKVGWPDRELLWLCKWGHWDKSDQRPWVTSLSPNQRAAYENFEGTLAAHELEVKRKWTRPSDKVPFIDMHMCQTNVVPKSDGSMRLLGNPSHPEPGTLMDTVDGVLIAPNRATDVDLLPDYEWATIEEFAEAVAIMVAVVVKARGWVAGQRVLALLVVVGTRDDLTKWFRQIPAFSGDWHKQVYNWAGRYLVDEHVQMGRVSSADGAQRLSMAARKILHDRVEERLRHELATNTTPLWDALREIVAFRRELADGNEITTTELWVIDLMQDDLAWVAISFEVGTIIREMTVTVMAEHGIDVSVAKRAEDEAAVPGPQPNPRILFIGGQFDTAVLEAATVRGQDKTVARFGEVVAEWAAYPPGKLAPRELLQTAVGMGMFHGRFGVRVRRRLNSGIRLLRGRRGGHVAVSPEWQRDLASIWEEVRQKRGVPLTVEPHWWHPGLLACNSDASRPDARPDAAMERGFGGNALHHYFYGEWTEEETERLDISTLELIAAGFLLLVAHMAGVTRVRMIMRCDNEAACRVVANHAATSVAMAEALLWFENVQRHVGVEVLLHHIAGVDNKIADDLSREERERAIVELRRLSGEEPQRWAIPDAWRDLSAIVATANRAAA